MENASVSLVARSSERCTDSCKLDEATFIDPERRSHSTGTPCELARGKTLIVIAHRISTVRNFDKIVVMDSGNIVAEGTHF